MRPATIFAVAVAAFLTACAPTQPLVSAPAPAGMVAFGTLATVGTCEYRLAGEYTALAVARYRAAQALDARRIDVAAARQVQSIADEARAALDRACVTPADEARERQAAAQARALRESIATLIGG